MIIVTPTEVKSDLMRIAKLTAKTLQKRIVKIPLMGLARMIITQQFCRRDKDMCVNMEKGRRAVCFLLLASSIFQAGCMATIGHYDAFRSLCYAPDNRNGWKDSRNREIGGVDYWFEVDEIYPSDTDVKFPVENMHWILLSGGTFGKAIGKPAPPMVFDPKAAELEMDGGITKAIPRLWRYESLSTKGDVLYEVSAPTNINVFGDIVTPSFLIAFPVKIKNLKEKYTFRPGTILLDGVRYSLPEYKSCYTPGRTWINPIK